MEACAIYCILKIYFFYFNAADANFSSSVNINVKIMQFVYMIDFRFSFL